MFQLMNEIIRFGTDKQYVCVSKASEAIEATTGSSSAANAPSNSDIESEDDEEVTEGILFIHGFVCLSDWLVICFKETIPNQIIRVLWEILLYK